MSPSKKSTVQIVWAMYLYTDIIERQLVGDTASLYMITYVEPHYILVNKQHIETILIEIKTDHNRYIPFCCGKVIMRLYVCLQKNGDSKRLWRSLDA